jgi:SAM-dependent methyltransferase
MDNETAVRLNRKAGQIATKWGALNPGPILDKTFFGFPPLRPYLIRSAFGVELAKRHAGNPYWAEDIFIELYLHGRQVESMLSLCCGFGEVEQYLLSRLGSVRRCVGVDLSRGALLAAAHRAKEHGLDEVVTYECSDLNQYRWPEAAYDVIVANGALHHLYNLEGVVSGIYRALRPGGILYCSEVVGPSWQNHRGRQAELINALAYLVPPHMRRRPMPTDRLRYVWAIATGANSPPELRPHWSRRQRTAWRVVNAVHGKLRWCANLRRDGSLPTLWHSNKKYLLRTDPSEGVRSEEIIPTLREVFGDLIVHQYGGPLLAYALDNTFYKAFDSNNDDHVALLEALTALESMFLHQGAIPIEHAILVARKPK